MRCQQSNKSIQKRILCIFDERAREWLSEREKENVNEWESTGHRPDSGNSIHLSALFCFGSTTVLVLSAYSSQIIDRKNSNNCIIRCTSFFSLLFFSFCLTFAHFCSISFRLSIRLLPSNVRHTHETLFFPLSRICGWIGPIEIALNLFDVRRAKWLLNLTFKEKRECDSYGTLQIYMDHMVSSSHHRDQILDEHKRANIVFYSCYKNTYFNPSGSDIYNHNCNQCVKILSDIDG